MSISFKRVNDAAQLPTRATAGSAGFDLYSCDFVDIDPGMRKAVDTGVKVFFPYNMCGQIWPRSGWALRHGIDVLAGIVDSDYYFTGESVKVILINHGDKMVRIEAGDRIAQIVFTKYSDGGHDGQEVRCGGFGSTGE